MRKNFHLGLLSLLLAAGAWSLAATACDDSLTPVEPGEGGTADGGVESGAELLPDDLQVKSYGSDPKALAVNSHVIFGKTNAALVDGQFFVADAQKVVELVKSTNTNLKYVILTHVHPDHFLGFKVIKDAFPSARFVTAEPIAKAYKDGAQAMFDASKAVYGDKIADGIVEIEGLPLVSAIDVPPHAPVDLDGNPLRLYMQKFPGDASTLLVVSLSEKRVITGDMVFNKAHLYLAECTTGDQGWKGNLAAVAPFLWNTFYPGHGPSPAKFDAVAENIKYLETATAIMRNVAGFPDAGPMPPEGADAGLSGPKVGRAVAKLRAAYPDYQGDAVLDLSVRGYIDGTPSTGGKNCQ